MITNYLYLHSIHLYKKSELRSANRIRNIFLFLIQKKKPLVFGQWQFIRNKKKEIIGNFLASLEVFRRIGEVFNLYVSQLTNPH